MIINSVGTPTLLKPQKRQKIKRLGLAGKTWGCSQDILNITYNTGTYVKPNSDLWKRSHRNLNQLERTQNSTLRLMCGAVKSIPTATMQQYTNNLPLTTEIKCQAATMYAKLQANPLKTGKNKDDINQTLKTQFLPLEMSNKYRESKPCCLLTTSGCTASAGYTGHPSPAKRRP
mgnify:CR=1 FL=1